MAYATASDVQALVSTADVQRYTPQGQTFATWIAIHLDESAAEIDAHLSDGGWALPLVGLSAQATTWLRAANVALSLEAAQLSQGGAARQQEGSSNVERRAAQFRRRLQMIAAGASLADMAGQVPLFVGDALTPEETSPYDLEQVYFAYR